MTQDDKAETAAIISLIYESIFAPKSLRGFVDGKGGQQGRTTDLGANNSLLDADNIEQVIPHLEQALSAGARQKALDEVREAHSHLLDGLSLPACVVAANLDLLRATDKALESFDQNGVLSLKTGRIVAEEPELQRQLIRAVTSAISSGDTHVLFSRNSRAGQGTLSIAPISWVEGEKGQAAAAIFFDFEVNNIDGLASALIASYGLSRSEAEVAAHLSLGRSLDEIAVKKNLSINTVRTQIKNAYAKTGTSRQGELVSLILNGPAMWLRLLKTSRYDNFPEAADVSDVDGTLTLADGRCLSFADYGPRRGKPVFFLHHLLGSRSERPGDLSILTRLDIRLIVPERPGIGKSTEMKKRSLVDCAEDVRQLADHLDVSRFHVAGFSSGGPHAAAVAAHLGDRVIKLGLIASLLPVDELPAGSHIGMMQRLLTSIARRWPAGARSLLEFRYRKMLDEPNAAIADFRVKGNRADIEILDDPAVNKIRLENLLKAQKIQPDVFARELIILSQPWGFSVSRIDAPVVMWHGWQDEYFSAEHASAISSLIGQCETTFRQEWGHFFLYQEWEDILEELVR